MNCAQCGATLAPGITFCPECGARRVEPPPPAEPAMPPRLLQGRYELQRRLGQGGMGSVYLASDRRLSTARWAVKEMSDAQITSPLERRQASEAFRHEAELLARLSHPRLPRVTDHFEEDGRNYLVMELVPGETLRDYGARVGLPRPVNEALEWGRQICEVLLYLHGQQPPVIFRDLKPANVMITPDGTLKLVDFGIARVFKAGQSRDTQAFGTLGYSAPEQYGRGQTDARSDVFSLGVLLHHLLTGHDPVSTPFRLPLASELNPAVPPAVATAIARATENDPDRRFASVAELQQALLGSGQLVSRQPPSGQLVAPATGPTHTLGRADGAAPPTTGLALAARWVGSIGAGMMLVATALMLTNLLGGADDILAGLGLLLAGVAVIVGLVGASLGLSALIGSAARQSLHGRRDAAIGVAGGGVVMVLCCVSFVLIGVLN